MKEPKRGLADRFFSAMELKNQKALMIVLGGIVAAGLVWSGYLLLADRGERLIASYREAAPPGVQDQVFALEEGGRIYIHVKGAVNAPGLYHVKKDIRVFEAVELAGGFAPDAYVDGVNLSKVLLDQEELEIPKIYTPKEEQEPASSAKPVKPAPPARVPLNLNTATAAQLTALPGVGPAIAERIVRYREENGGFARPEDVMRVKGVTRKLYDQWSEGVVLVAQ